MATIEPVNQQSISDDQELAKVLAGVSQQADDAATAGAGTTFDAPAVTPPTDAAAVEEAPDATVSEPVVDDAAAAPTVEPVAATSAPTLPDDLDSVKQEALSELRPLVDKLNVSAEEKFDTYLLLLRSTDDKDLIAPAHDAAKAISDEARRAQALLDIIKEIDFLSGANQTQ